MQSFGICLSGPSCSPFREMPVSEMSERTSPFFFATTSVMEDFRRWGATRVLAWLDQEFRLIEGRQLPAAI